AGIPPLAGFFSKDEILAGAFSYSKFVWLLGVIAAGFTAFYMFRLYYMTFQGSYRGAHVEGIEQSEPEHGGHPLIPDQRHLDQGDEHTDKGHGHHLHAHEPHESPLSMTGVLWVLAVLSIVGGWIGIPAALGGKHPTPFQRWLEPVLAPIGGRPFHFHEASHALEWALMAVSVAIAASGIYLAYRFYLRDATWSVPKRLATRFRPLYALVANKYYVDEIYAATVIRATLLVSLACSWFDKYVVDGLVNLVRHATVVVFGYGLQLLDRFVVDGAVNGIGWSAQSGSMLLRRVQSGFVQNYALIMGGGIVLLTLVYLFLKP
ncbi:MAG TPA: hypothetical protein VNL91_06370, partial [Thermoanaerobaculia bacterium]|nr:hypothetical protein [Thermoanaerobaculia bacterium]